MDDILSMQVRKHDDGSITLHQEKMITKMFERFAPDVPKAQVNSTPYSPNILANVLAAIPDPFASEGDTASAPAFPELVRPCQDRCGALMYIHSQFHAACHRVPHTSAVPLHDAPHAGHHD